MAAAHDTAGDGAAVRAWRAGRRRTWLALLLATLAPWLGFDWGKPGLLDPSPDAPWPIRSLLAAEAWPAGELPHDKYPEGWHLLAGAAEQLACAAWLTDAEAAQLAQLRERIAAAVAARHGDATFDPSALLQAEGAGFEVGAWKLVVAGRLLALLMVVLLAAAAGELAMAAAGPRFGWVGALAIALQPAVVHYGATLNTDVPALAWSALAWALLVAGRVPPGALRVVAAGAALGLAAATKDQYAAMAPGIALFAWRRGAGAASGRLARAGLLLLGGAAAYALTSGVLHHAPGRAIGSTWRDHVAHLFGDGSQPFRIHDLSPRGVLGLLDDTFERLVAAAGVAGVAGLGLLVVQVVARRRWRALAWLLPGLGYLALFLAPAGYVYPRFTLPLGLCGAIGLAFALGHARGVRGAQRVVIAALALVYLGAEASQVVTSKWSDPRPASVAALAARRAPGDEVWLCSEPWLYAPFPPVAAPTRVRELREMAAAVRDGEAPPRWLWFATERRNALVTPDAIASIEKRLRVRLVERFDPAPTGNLANDPDGLLLPVVLLFERVP